MRTKFFAAVAAIALAVVGFALLSPADAQTGNTFTVVKVVEGPVPDGAVFEVEVTCEPEINKAPEGGGVSETVTFDQDGNPTSNNTFNVGLFETCTAVETVTNGAVVSYSCEASAPVGAPADEGQSQIQCVDDQTVYYGEIVDAQGTITVTNTFEELPPPPPDVEPDDVVPDVVNASPSFTG